MPGAALRRGRTGAQAGPVPAVAASARLWQPVPRTTGSLRPYGLAGRTGRSGKRSPGSLGGGRGSLSLPPESRRPPMAAEEAAVVAAVAAAADRGQRDGGARVGPGVGLRVWMITLGVVVLRAAAGELDVREARPAASTCFAAWPASGRPRSGPGVCAAALPTVRVTVELLSACGVARRGSGRATLPTWFGSAFPPRSLLTSKPVVLQLLLGGVEGLALDVRDVRLRLSLATVSVISCSWSASRPAVGVLLERRCPACGRTPGSCSRPVKPLPRAASVGLVERQADDVRHRRPSAAPERH